MEGQMTRISAVIAFGASLLAAPAAAETVFDNYTGTTRADLNATFIAAAFTPSTDYNFTDASAFVDNQGPNPDLFSIALYSSTASAGPDAQLWTSGAVSAPAAAYTLVSASYNGSPITLQKGEEYFFVLELTNTAFGGQVFWAEDGKTTVQTYHSPDGSSWNAFAVPIDLQFRVFGAAVPEFSTWAMMLLGFAGLGYAGYRRARTPRAA
jgi:hypothetical protein